MGESVAAKARKATPEDLAFEEEFAKMMRDTVEQSGRSHLQGMAVGGDNMVVPLGMHKVQVKSQGVVVEEGSVGLTLLKKGVKGKVEARRLVVPEDATLAKASMKDTVATERARLGEAKKLVFKAAETLTYGGEE